MNVRWIAAALAVLVLAGVCVQLGRWQLHRLDERKARNDVTRANLAAPPAPLDQIVGPQGVVGDQHAWRTVVVTGTLRRVQADRHALPQRRATGPGFEIVTPLMLADGKAVLVDRGFLARQGAELAPLQHSRRTDRRGDDHRPAAAQRARRPHQRRYAGRRYGATDQRTGLRARPSG